MEPKTRRSASGRRAPAGPTRRGRGCSPARGGCSCTCCRVARPTRPEPTPPRQSVSGLAVQVMVTPRPKGPPRLRPCEWSGHHLEELLPEPAHVAELAVAALHQRLVIEPPQLVELLLQDRVEAPEERLVRDVGASRGLGDDRLH